MYLTVLGEFFLRYASDGECAWERIKAFRARYRCQSLHTVRVRGVVNGVTHSSMGSPSLSSPSMQPSRTQVRPLRTVFGNERSKRGDLARAPYNGVAVSNRQVGRGLGGAPYLRFVWGKRTQGNNYR